MAPLDRVVIVDRTIYTAMATCLKEYVLANNGRFYFNSYDLHFFIY
jgi:hypothetical protein